MRIFLAVTRVSVVLCTYAAIRNYFEKKEILCVKRYVLAIIALLSNHRNKIERGARRGGPLSLLHYICPGHVTASSALAGRTIDHLVLAARGL